MTVVQLKKLASDRGLSGVSRFKKEQLIEILGETEDMAVQKQKALVKSERKSFNDMDPSFLVKKVNGPSKFIQIAQLGRPGKEGTVFLVMDGDANRYAMKTFRKTKSGKTLEKEAYFQYLASKKGVSPNIIEYNTEEKYIVMDVLEKTLLEVVHDQKGVLTESQQKQLVTLYKTLDEVGVMINDGNPLNIMTKGKRFYLIDYGFAKFTSHKDFKNYKNPNIELMPLGLLLWLKGKIETKKWTYLRGQIKPDIYQKMSIDSWP
jgi:predicted Ser/Thr protein kinase